VVPGGSLVLYNLRRIKSLVFEGFEMSRSKDASSKLHEKHQMILADLLRDEDNKYCADCMAKGD